MAHIFCADHGYIDTCVDEGCSFYCIQCNKYPDEPPGEIMLTHEPPTAEEHALLAEFAREHRLSPAEMKFPKN